MSTIRFKIVFDGTLLPGVDKSTAQLNLAELFKSDVAATEHLFSGQPIELKRDLSEADAQRYLEALQKTGIDARIEAEQVLDLSLDHIDQPSLAPSMLSSDSLYAPPRATVGEPLPEFAELNVFSFQGRIGRLRYLAWTLVLSVAMMLVVGAGILVSLAGSMTLQPSSISLVLGVLGAVTAFIAFNVVSIQISVQRLHDLGWSGWLWLLNFVPVVGGLFLLVLIVSPGSNTPNRYGAPPPPNSTAVKVLSWMWVVLIALIIVTMVAGGISSFNERYR